MDGSKHPERSQNVRSHKRSAFRRASDADFEVPFFDEEDDGHHERSYVETGREQKAMFERQRQDLQKMRAVSSSVGASVFLRHQKTQQAEKWLEEELRKLTAKAQDDLKATGGETGGVGGESKVLEKIEDPNRPALQIKLLPIATKKAATASKSKDTDKKKKKKKRKRAVNAFELD
uniref:Uncharacterized protein n=1 Tax=Craspedostauros australis TaxID=1486917 RepID=A0A7R9WTQ8_9STRA